MTSRVHWTSLRITSRLHWKSLELCLDIISSWYLRFLPTQQTSSQLCPRPSSCTKGKNIIDGFKFHDRFKKEKFFQLIFFFWISTLAHCRIIHLKIIMTLCAVRRVIQRKEKKSFSAFSHWNFLSCDLRAPDLKDQGVCIGAQMEENRAEIT